MLLTTFEVQYAFFVILGGFLVRCHNLFSLMFFSISMKSNFFSFRMMNFNKFEMKILVQIIHYPCWIILQYLSNFVVVDSCLHNLLILTFTIKTGIARFMESLN